MTKARAQLLLNNTILIRNRYRDHYRRMEAEIAQLPGSVSEQDLLDAYTDWQLAENNVLLAQLDLDGAT